MNRGFLTITEQVEDIHKFARNPQPRVPTGLPSVDVMALGPAPGEVFDFVGASGSGKSIVGTNIMWRNPDVPMIFFSMEMPARLALQRLYGHWDDYPVTQLIEDTESNMLPPKINALGEYFQQHLVVPDSLLSLGDMSKYLAVYDEYYGVRPKAVVIDYLELIAGSDGEPSTQVTATARNLKRWAKAEQIAVFVLHQTNMKHDPWEAPRQDSPRYGGFTEADVMIGIWQPAKDPDLEEYDRRSMRYKLHMHVIKNRITGRESEGREMVYKITPSLRLVDLTERETREFYRK